VTARPVLLPRPVGRGGDLAALLGAQGVRVEHHPLLALTVEDSPALRTALDDLAAGRYTHLVVTSRTTVGALLTVRERQGAAEGIVVPTGTLVIAVGPGTAAELRAAGIRVDHVAAGSGAALVEEFPTLAGPTLAGPTLAGSTLGGSTPTATTPTPTGSSTAPARVLFPTSAAAASTVRRGLEALGDLVARVDQVTAYRPEALTPPPAVAAALREGDYAAVVLTSPMIARHVAGIGVGPGTAVVTIGAPTTDAARKTGLTASVQADAPDDAHLAAAVQQALHRPGNAPRTATPDDPQEDR